MRGAASVLIGHRMASDKHVHNLVRKVEERVVSRRVSA
jgi:hypothetical protein